MGLKMNNSFMQSRLVAVISDVDETIADLYLPAEVPMLEALTELLSLGTKLVLITGQSVDNVERRVVNLLPSIYRNHILVGHCSGAELWGYDTDGKRLTTPHYSMYQGQMSSEMVRAWRETIKMVLDEFKLQVLPTMPLRQFNEEVGDDPWVVMYEDRGPQITIEFVNAYCMNNSQQNRYSDRLGRKVSGNDLRSEVKARAENLLNKASVKISPRLAGIFALDFALENVTKANAVRAAFQNDLNFVQEVDKPCMNNGHLFQVWGDKFSVKDGTDWHMTVAMPQSTLSISFRNENVEEMPSGYYVRQWGGKNRLHHGLTEYLKSELLPLLRGGKAEQIG